APPAKHPVGDAFVELNRRAFLPFLFGSLVQPLYVSTFPTRRSPDLAPLLNISVAVTINVLVLLKNRVELLFLLMVTLLTVNEAGIEINVCPPPNVRLLAFGLNVAAVPTVKWLESESVPPGGLNVPAV